MPPREPFARSVAAISWAIVRLVGAGDEALHAVDDVVIAVPNGGGAHAAGIAAGIGLGLRQAPVELAADGRQQVLLLLRVVEVIEDRADVRAEDVAAARRQRDGAAELGPHRHLGDEPHAEPAVLQRHVVAGKPKLLAPWPQLRAHLGLELMAVAAVRSIGISSRSTNLRTVSLSIRISSGRSKLRPPEGAAVTSSMASLPCRGGREQQTRPRPPLAGGPAGCPWTTAWSRGNRYQGQAFARDRGTMRSPGVPMAIGLRLRIAYRLNGLRGRSSTALEPDGAFGHGGALRAGGPKTILYVRGAKVRALRTWRSGA